jgi:hypothetical protein
MRRFALVLIASLFVGMSVHAQDGYPLLTDLARITPDNTAQWIERVSI